MGTVGVTFEDGKVQSYDRKSTLCLRIKAEGEQDEPTHFFLYLSLDTFVGASGDALAAQLRVARAQGLPIVVAHENDHVKRGCEFSRFFEVTPKDIIQDGIFDTIATPLMRGQHREVSLVMLAKKLGAKQKQLHTRFKTSKSFNSTTTSVDSVGKRRAARTLLPWRISSQRIRSSLSGRPMQVVAAKLQ